MLAERTKKMLQLEEEDSERKLRLDESQTEKELYTEGQYRLQHLDGEFVLKLNYFTPGKEKTH